MENIVAVVVFTVMSVTLLEIIIIIIIILTVQTITIVEIQYAHLWLLLSLRLVRPHGLLHLQVFAVVVITLTNLVKKLSAVSSWLWGVFLVLKDGPTVWSLR